jgi:hypothetical protein
MKLLSIFIVSILIYSCAYREEQNELRKVSNALKLVENGILKIDKNKIVGKSDSLTILFKNVKENYTIDTIDAKFSAAMNNLKQTRRFYRKANGKLISIEGDVAKVRVSLNNLKNDITNKAGNTKKYSEYINFEFDKVEKISMNFEEFKKNLETNYFNYQQNVALINVSLKK